MRYFSGTLSRDGRPLGDVIGEIRSGPTGEFGHMEIRGWIPDPWEMGPKTRSRFRIEDEQGFVATIVIDGAISFNFSRQDRARATLVFSVVGAPIVMPEAASLVPAGGPAGG